MAKKSLVSRDLVKRVFGKKAKEVRAKYFESKKKPRKSDNSTELTQGEQRRRSGGV